jgi:demethylmenaquinone methyltransferase/2-methoxy-6-polyprenyl-1,4-benzoquinol methylase
MTSVCALFWIEKLGKLVMSLKDTLPPSTEKAAVVRAMFDRIAPRYDLLNRLLSLSLDQRWRRMTIRAAAISATDTVVDLACGTGDLSELATATGAYVVGIDFSANMLAGARRREVRAAFIQADANRLPLPDAWATVMISGFALRNFASIPAVLAEATRVLKPDGRLVFLEIDTPQNRLFRWGHRLYFQRLVPTFGALFSDPRAYAYLPHSLSYLPGQSELQQMIEAAGFYQVTKRQLSGGVAQLITTVRKPG